MADDTPQSTATAEQPPASSDEPGQNPTSDNLGSDDVLAHFLPSVEEPGTPPQEQEIPDSEQPEPEAESISPVEEPALAEAPPDEPSTRDVLSQHYDLSTFTEEQVEELAKTLNPKVFRSMKKRIDGLYGRMKTLEGERDTQQEAVAQSPDSPFGKFRDTASLQTEQRDWERWRDDIETGLTEGEESFTVDGTEYTRKQGIDNLRTIKEALRVHFPARYSALSTKADCETATIKQFPFLKDPTNPLTEAVSQFERNPMYAPALEIPNSKALFTMAALGAQRYAELVKQQSAQKNGVVKTAPARQAPPAPARATAPPGPSRRVVSDAQKRIDDARAKVGVPGSANTSVENYFLAKELAKT